MQVAEILRDRLSEFRAANRHYDIGKVVVTVLCGYLCGRDSLLGVRRWLSGLGDEEVHALGYVHRNHMPCHATLCNLMGGIDGKELDAALLGLVICGDSVGGVLSIDGKRFRGSRVGEKRGMHVIEAFCDELRVVIGQEEMGEEENEVKAALRLLSRLDLKEKIVTGDAMFSKPEVVEKITAQGGDYVLALKGNNQDLERRIASAFLCENMGAADALSPGEQGKNLHHTGQGARTGRKKRDKNSSHQ